MQTQRIVLSLAVAIGAAGVIVPASSQEYRGTWEQQMACTPDVWRLCGDQIPNRVPNSSRPIALRRSVCRNRPRHVAARRNKCSRSRNRSMRKTNRPLLPARA